MAVGMSIFATRLYDKINSVGKMAKYKLSQCQYAAIFQKYRSQMPAWRQKKSAKNNFMD